MGNEMFQQYSSQLDMPHSMPGAQLLQTATAGLPIPQGPRRAAATTRLQNITFVPKNEDKAYGYVRVIKPTPNLHTRKPAIRPSQAIASHAAFTRARYAVGKPTKPRRLRKYDITLHLWRKNSSRRRRALGMLDSGNRFGALLDLRVALALGYRAADLAGPPRVLQTVGGGELLTAGVVKIRYYVGGDADTLHERDFHVLETLAGGYDVNLPMGEVDPDGQAEGEAEVEGEAEGGEPPVVAWTVQKKREPTEDELRAMAERVREAEAAAERAEEERAVREAAKKAAKKAAKRDKEKEKKSGKGL
ncbi:2b9c96e6-f9e0-477a-af68-fff339d159d8 [Thermothielavioides terrestris]|uniref:2b9c96e6-f9e0-477a-af68-fff339d159d8 n=1 Tax=Thermothielavioides terrestris TaxID=2587410 RepID=A0A446B5C0_9PEZI|nr:2b9c96e6-f9e0-477a-af68-fff339d159d8 [Thermothielavioides terrestris]